MPCSFIKNLKECRESFVLFIKSATERENISFFEKNAKERENVAFF